MMPLSIKFKIFILKLAQSHGMTISEESMQNSTTLVQALNQLVSNQPPSEKAIKYAERLAESKCISLPDNIKENKKSLSNWINAAEQKN